MNLASITRTLGHVIQRNSPAILTGLAVTGVVATVASAIKATPAAYNAIWHEDRDPYTKITPKLVVKETWRIYIPTLLIGGATITCIIGAQTLNSKRVAALVSAYSIADAAHKEYQVKAAEALGASGEKKVRAAIADERVANNPPTINEELIVTGKGDHICMDMLTGRYFRSDIETVRKAVNDLNLFLINNQYASQNVFYRYLGIPEVSIGDTLGWRADHPMEPRFSSALYEGVPVFTIDYMELPIEGYDRVW